VDSRAEKILVAITLLLVPALSLGAERTVLMEEFSNGW